MKCVISVLGKDRSGVVAAIAGVLADCGANIDDIRIERLHQGVGDLAGQALLHLGALREAIHEPGQLRDAADAAVLPGDVGHMRPPEERRQVMLSPRVYSVVITWPQPFTRSYDNRGYSED